MPKHHQINLAILAEGHIACFAAETRHALRSATRRSYAQLIRDDLKPRLGGFALRELTVGKTQAMFTAWFVDDTSCSYSTSVGFYKADVSYLVPFVTAQWPSRLVCLPCGAGSLPGPLDPISAGFGATCVRIAVGVSRLGNQMVASRTELARMVGGNAST